jgi:N-succinyl-L-ornithine transcarbamylase
LITIEEFKTKPVPKVVLAWAPHIKALPQAVPNSFAEWMNRAEVDFTITHPEGYELAPEFTGNAKVEYNFEAALKNADFIYVKNWSSYKDYGKVITMDSKWMLNNSLLSLTNNAKVMHCLPVRRGVELADEILDGPNSLVIHEAANRVWAAQAVLSEILRNI